MERKGVCHLHYARNATARMDSSSLPLFRAEKHSGASTWSRQMEKRSGRHTMHTVITEMRNNKVTVILLALKVITNKTRNNNYDVEYLMKKLQRLHPFDDEPVVVLFSSSLEFIALQARCRATGAFCVFLAPMRFCGSRVEIDVTFYPGRSVCSFRLFEIEVLVIESRLFLMVEWVPV